MKRVPLVTIVTPSFNQGRFIRATIESVLSQDYPRIEYIIVDGASPDDTQEVVKPYLDRLTFISEPDRGQSHAINKGFAMARGEVVAWLNSDDVFLPGAISRAVESFRANPALGVVYGEGYQIDEAGNVRQRFPYTQHFDLWKLAYVSDYILQQSTFFRKAALDAIGPVREDLHYVMDWELLIRLAKRFDFERVDEYLGCLREYGTAKTFTGGRKRVREIERVLREHTGSAFAPGYLVYGLATYEGIWTGKIDAWPRYLRPGARLLRRVVSRVCYWAIGLAVRYGQAWHRDGWMGPSARLMLPFGSGEVLLRGTVPVGIPGLDHQTITVRHGRSVMARETLPPGEFQLRFALSPAVEDCPVLRVESNRSFNFARLGESTDARTLSLLVHEVRWADS